MSGAMSRAGDRLVREKSRAVAAGMFGIRTPGETTPKRQRKRYTQQHLMVRVLFSDRPSAPFTGLCPPKAGIDQALRPGANRTFLLFLFSTLQRA